MGAVPRMRLTRYCTIMRGPSGGDWRVVAQVAVEIPGVSLLNYI